MVVDEVDEAEFAMEDTRLAIQEQEHVHSLEIVDGYDDGEGSFVMLQQQQV